MGSYRFNERWEKFSRELRRQWVKFRKAHLVQDEEYNEQATSQCPRRTADAWGCSESGRRREAVTVPVAYGEVYAYTKLSVDGGDTVEIHRSKDELAVILGKDRL